MIYITNIQAFSSMILVQICRILKLFYLLANKIVMIVIRVKQHEGQFKNCQMWGGVVYGEIHKKDEYPSELRLV